MILKVHKTQEGKNIISICDSNLIGKKFCEKNRQLDLSSSFYMGEEKGKDEIRIAVKNAYILNIAGEESVSFCFGEGRISKRSIIRVKNIPCAQCLFASG